jgi:hypothetical protein
MKYKNLYSDPSFMMIVFFILLISLFLGCGNCNNPRLFNPTQEKHIPESPTPQKKQISNVVVVFLHDMGDINGSKSGLEPLRDKLSKSLSTDTQEITVIALVRPGETSFTDSLNKQIETTFAALKKCTSQDNELIIYGHGQGGVLAAGLWCAHNTDLKIKGLILDRAPLEGVYCFGHGGLIKQLGGFLPANGWIKKYFSFHSSAGLKDLKPNSTFLTELKAGLEKIDIPVILLGSTVSDDEAIKNIFDTLYNQVNEWLETNGTFFYRFFTVYILSGIDGLVDIKSQLLDSLGEKNKNISRYILPDIGLFHWVSRANVVEGYNQLYDRINALL